MTLEQLTAYIKAFESARAAFDSIKPMNTYKFDISLNDKVVFECDGKICRVSPAYDAAIRLEVCKFFEKKGFDIFQPEEIIAECCTPYLTTTMQEIVTPTSFQTRGEAMDELLKRFTANQQKEIRELFERLKIIGWANNENCGFDKNGQLKIFDYVANVSVRDIGLTDAFGEVLSGVR